MKHRANFENEPASSQALQTETASKQSSDVLDQFPTTNQAVSESFLKEMMLALRSSIQQSFTDALNQQISALDNLAERVNHVEDKMGEFSEAHNTLVDSHNHLEDEMRVLTAKLADLEDRNRRHNVKFRWEFLNLSLLLI